MNAPGITISSRNSSNGAPYPVAPVSLQAGVDSALLNTAAIQAALDVGGYIETPPGDFYINNTLSAGLTDGTKTIWRGNNTKLIMAPGSGKPMLATKSHQSGYTEVTLTYTSGSLVSVGWTAHGMAVGDYVCLDQWLPSEYNGVFRVESVTDEDNFVVYLQCLPTASPSAHPRTGPGRAKKASRNLVIEGVSFDGNWPASDPTNQTLNTMGVIIGAAHRVGMRNCDTYNFEKYTVFCYHVSDVHIADMYTDTFSDGVHIFGAAFNCSVRRITGKTGDDLVAFSNRDITFTPAGGYVDIAGGDLINCTAEDVNGRCGDSMANVQVYSQNPYRTRNLRLINVAGSSAASIRFLGDIVLGGTIESVFIHGSNANGNYTVDFRGQGGSLCVDYAEISGCNFEPQSNTTYPINGDSFHLVKRLVITGAIMKNPSWGGVTAALCRVNAHYISMDAMAVFGTSGRGLSLIAVVSGTPTGTNTYALTAAPALGSYANGTILAFEPGNNNTAASTININALGAKALKKADGVTDFASGELSSLNRYYFVYSTTTGVFTLLGQTPKGKRMFKLSGQYDGGNSSIAVALDNTNSDPCSILVEDFQANRIGQLVNVQTPCDVSLNNVSTNANTGGVCVFGANNPTISIDIRNVKWISTTAGLVNSTVACTLNITGDKLESNNANWLVVTAGVAPVINLKSFGLPFNVTRDLDSGAGTLVPSAALGNFSMHSGTNPGPCAGNGTIFKSCINGALDPA